VKLHTYTDLNTWETMAKFSTEEKSVSFSIEKLDDLRAYHGNGALIDAIQCFGLDETETEFFLSVQVMGDRWGFHS
jgi:hypothetical protein